MGPKYTGKFFERKMGVINILMTKNYRESQDDPDGVFILFKKTDFNTTLACLGVKVYR